MQKTYEVMTHDLATCTPETSVAHVSAMMLDRDIGDVLILDNNKLCGIVTDRDLAVQALTGTDNPLETPIKKYMSTKVITGETGWSLDRVASIMSKYQIRRLPILQDGQLVGIISLGDLACNENQKDAAAKSLHAISSPGSSAAPRGAEYGGILIGFGLTALATTVAAWLQWSRVGRELRQKFEDGI